MIVRRYQAKDYAMIQAWMAGRNLHFPPPSQLPKRGFLIDDVACIFLIKPDCKVGIIEYFITNQNVAEDTRLQAVDKIIVEIEKEAIKLGMEVLMGNTTIPKVMALGLRYGFKGHPEPYFFFRKTLNGGSIHAGTSSGASCSASQ